MCVCVCVYTACFILSHETLAREETRWKKSGKKRKRQSGYDEEGESALRGKVLF